VQHINPLAETASRFRSVFCLLACVTRKDPSGETVSRTNGAYQLRHSPIPRSNRVSDPTFGIDGRAGFSAAPSSQRIPRSS